MCFGGAALSGLVISTILGWDAPLFTDAAHGTWHWMPWVVLAFILIFPTYLSYWLMPIGLKYLKTTVVAMYGYLILIVTTVVSYIVGQDRIYLGTGGGYRDDMSECVLCGGSGEER